MLVENLIKFATLSSSRVILAASQWAGRVLELSRGANIIQKKCELNYEIVWNHKKKWKKIQDAIFPIDIVCIPYWIRPVEISFHVYMYICLFLVSVLSENVDQFCKFESVSAPFFHLYHGCFSIQLCQQFSHFIHHWHNAKMFVK